MRVGGEWAWEDYKHPSVLDASESGRRDFVQIYSLTLSKKLGEGVEVQGLVVWTDDDSNVRTRDREAPYSFDRAFFGVSILVEF